MGQFLRVICAGTVAFGFLAGGVRAQVSCLPIDRIDLLGASLLSAAETQAVIAPFEGRCLGLGEINDVLQTVTLAYVDRGYTTSRAYLPEQNLADGSLEVRVVEGELSEIRFNGEVDPVWEARVFPGLIGKPFNLREVEQGIDTIRDMQTFVAEMEVSAGAVEGQSVMDVTATSERPYTILVSSNNQGEEETGDYITSLDLSYDHFFGWNETLSFNVGKSVDANPLNIAYQGPGTYSGSFGVSVPSGPWLFDGEFSWSNYHRTTEGAIDPIPISGWTETFALSATRLVHRDQDSKTLLEFSLNRRKNENYVITALLGSSSRTISSFGLTLHHERSLWGGDLDLSFGVEQGTKWFGAEDHSQQPDGQPNAQYSLVNFSVDYDHGWQAGSGFLNYATTFKGQWSDDSLYGTQQFSVGGNSTVRGAKSGLLAGNSGILWRNELRYTFGEQVSSQIGRVTIYSAIDFGRIFSDNGLSISGGNIGGVAIGIRNSGGFLNLDFSYQEIFETPDDVAKPDGIFVFSVSHSF